MHSPSVNMVCIEIPLVHVYEQEANERGKADEQEHGGHDVFDPVRFFPVRALDHAPLDPDAVENPMDTCSSTRGMSTK